MDDIEMPVIVSTPVVQEQSKSQLLEALQEEGLDGYRQRASGRLGLNW